jgi:hypothetical protein
VKESEHWNELTVALFEEQRLAIRSGQDLDVVLAFKKLRLIFFTI